MNYQEVYKNTKGACASCIHARSIIKGKSIRDESILISYDGGKEVYCAAGNLSSSGAWIRDEPDYNYPPNDCWKPKESEG